MLEMLINFIMQIIITIINFIFSPFMNALFALFPSVGEYFSHITSFFSQAFTYVATILQWFCFSPSMFVLLFDYYIIKYSVHLLIVAIKFAINMYNKLKP